MKVVNGGPLVEYDLALTRKSIPFTVYGNRAYKARILVQPHDPNAFFSSLVNGQMMDGINNGLDDDVSIQSN